MTMTNWHSCWGAVPVYAYHQYCFCITTKVLPCAALKFRNINWLLQNLGKYIWLAISWNVRCKALAWSEQFTCLCAPMCTPIWVIFHVFSFYRLPAYFKVLMLECLHFSHTTGSLVLWWVNDATVGVLLMFCSYQCDRVQTPIRNTL